MSEHIPTLAEVCSAIAEGRLAASSDGSTYQVSAFELRRYFNTRRSLPVISYLDALLSTSRASTCGESSEWSPYKLCPGL
jgi:hypothetical protein